MNKHQISYLLPLCSVIIILCALYFLKPGVTGLAIYEPNQTNPLVNAEVTLKTSAEEIIPPHAIVEVQLNNHKARMSVKEFIEKTARPYEISQGKLHGYEGLGYSGDHTYTLQLSDFPLDRSITSGEQAFTLRILFQHQVLYEKENNVMIS